MAKTIYPSALIKVLTQLLYYSFRISSPSKIKTTIKIKTLK